MVSQFAYTQLGPLPAVAIMGILTILFLFSTALVGLLSFKGYTVIPFKWHPRLAATTITLAIIHAFLALSVYLNY